MDTIDLNSECQKGMAWIKGKLDDFPALLFEIKMDSQGGRRPTRKSRTGLLTLCALSSSTRTRQSSSERQGNITKFRMIQFAIDFVDKMSRNVS